MTTNCLMGAAGGSHIPELGGFWLRSVRDKRKRRWYLPGFEKTSISDPRVW